MTTTWFCITLGLSFIGIGLALWRADVQAKRARAADRRAEIAERDRNVLLDANWDWPAKKSDSERWAA